VETLWEVKKHHGKPFENLVEALWEVKKHHGNLLRTWWKHFGKLRNTMGTF
jgi:hypothetical protein